MKKKKFRRDSIAKQKSKDTVNASSNLVKKILDLDPQTRTLISKPLIEEKRKPSSAYKYGHYFNLPMPKSVEDAVRQKILPQEIIINSLKRLEKTRKFKEDELFWMGFSFKPMYTLDMRKRLFSFNSILEGMEISSYSEKWASRFKNVDYRIKQGIHVYDEYKDKQQVNRLGAYAFVSVPSREIGSPRYKIKFSDIALEDNQYKFLLPFNYNPEYVSITPKIKDYDEIKFPNLKSSIKNAKIAYPQDIAGYLGVARHYSSYSLVPAQTMPFMLFSKESANFYEKLSNNWLIRDDEDKKFRHPYRAEKSIMLGRLIKTFGVENSLRDKSRDGSLINYFDRQTI